MLLGYLLQRKDGRGATGRDLVDGIGLMTIAVSYHLRVLLSADLVVSVENALQTGGVETPYLATTAAGA
jgi:hypothetical protein